MNVQVGDAIPEWDMPSVLPERMRTMAAILRDPNPVHWDRRVCAKLGFGERTINQGPLGLSYMVNMLHGMGIETGVDLDKLVDIGQWICGVLGKQPASRAGRALAAKKPR